MFIIQLLIGLALNILAALLTPRPEQEKKEVQELEDQTAEAGKPVPVVFGTVLINSPNMIEFVNRGFLEREVDAPKSKK